MREKIKVAIYLRTATKKVETLKRQEQLLIEYCNKRGYEITMIYKDFGVSGNELFKPELETLLEEIQGKGISAIVIKSLDRLTRDIIELVDYVKYITEECYCNVETAINKNIYSDIRDIIGGETEWNKMIERLLPSTQEYQL